MMNESKKNRVSVDALKGMQSVRATFTLPPQSIALLSAVASQLGVKQKSIFDHLVEDERRLDRLADEARAYTPKKKTRRQKTFVLSKNSLSALEAIAKTYDLPRDLLVEASIRQLRPVIDMEKEKHENRKVLLEEMQAFLDRGIQLKEKAGHLVGEDDEIFGKIGTLVDLHCRVVQDLETMIQKGKCMEAIS